MAERRELAVNNIHPLGPWDTPGAGGERQSNHKDYKVEYLDSPKWGGEGTSEI